MKSIPTIGKTYNCFDDGKIRESRRYEVTITELIPFKDAAINIIKLWVDNGITSDWLFVETDYFVKSESTENEDYPECIFARTVDGGWFGLGGYFNSGRLDIDGELTEFLNR